MSIKLPKGFKLSTAQGAIKAPGREDMALIYTDVLATVAGTFTRNKVKAAPVIMDMVKIRSGLGRAIVINSGNANACTGETGMLDTRRMAEETALHLGVDARHVYVCSTGVIGVPMPMKRIIPALKHLAEGVGTSSVEDMAKSIMTTDSFPKYVSKQVKIDSHTATITGVCKGAGMIEPDMATMLCFIMTDLKVASTTLSAALKPAVDESFNSMTVDGECSTNDTVLFMASGALDNTELKMTSPGFKKFAQAVKELSFELAKMIARDGEGATKLLKVKVKGTKQLLHAKKAAKAIGNSLLVKTAVYGNDPNWGRIISTLGSAGIPLDEEKVDIYFGRVKVASQGLSTGNEKKAEAVMKKDEVTITVDLNSGFFEADVLSCDLTEEYIKINAEYTT